MNNQLVLISHVLCPYVQRVAIVMMEKGIEHQRRDVDLANKPQWFLAISPLGKTPVLDVGGHALFESAVICEYLEESFAHALHPGDSLARARHRSWMEFSSSILNNIAGFYSASNNELLHQKRDALAQQFQRLESELSSAPYFSGDKFSMVDAFFGPVFRYFDVFEQIDDFGFFQHCPKVLAWRKQLVARESVQRAVTPDYPGRLYDFLRNKNSALSQLMVSE
ncbi:MAG TPA: glutathione S-transferase family protein [Gammaproteobacteria bacterium]|nr:glutathione S-transferase family protein [Gammaproteobacteria bacterium]